MHLKKEEICIREKAKGTQHDPHFESANDEEHLEAPHRLILAVNAVKKMLIFVRAKIYSKVIQGLCLTLHLLY